MTDFPSFSPIGDRPIVYVREVKAADLPDEVRARTGGLEMLYAIHTSDGEVLALAPDRRVAFIVARQNKMSPVSAH